MKFIMKKQTMKKVLAMVLCAIMLVSIVSTDAIANTVMRTGSTSDVFTVTVTDKYTGESVKEADIKITSSDNTLTFTGKTGNDGIAEIQDVTSYFEEGGVAFDAVYTVTADGYADVTITEAINVSEGNGNISVEMSDIIPPSVASVTGNANTWTTGNVTLLVASNDADTKQYRCNDGEWKDTASFVIESNGTYNFYVKDAAGNVSVAYEVIVSYIDKTAPVIGSVTINPDTWTKEVVELVVNATDEGCGAVKQYKMDDGEWQSSNTFEVADDSIHSFYAKDELGNETTVAFEARADKYDDVKPTISAVIPEEGWSNEEIKFTVEASDNSSGVAYYSVDDNSDSATWQTTNQFVIKDTEVHVYYVKDNAGNVSEGFTAEIAKIEKKVPVITQIVLSETEWTNKNITFTVNATDEGGSEIAGYRVDGGAWQTSPEFVIADDLPHSFEVKDNAGNISEIKDGQAEKYDGNAPEIEEVVADSDDFTNKKITVTVNAKDDKSGVHSYRMDDGEWQTSSKFGINNKKPHYFEVKDSAGNISETKEFCSEYYDEKAPELIGVNFVTENNNKFSQFLNFLSFGIFFNKSLKVEVKVQDNNDDSNNSSGIQEVWLYFYNEEGLVRSDSKSVTYGNKDNRDKEEILAFVIKDYSELENFKGTVKVSVQDNAGNLAENIQLTKTNSNLGTHTDFMIENDAPVISEIKPSEDTITKDDFNFVFDVNDKQKDKLYSGIAAVRVTVNGQQVLLDDFSEEQELKPDEHYEVPVIITDKKVNGKTIERWNKGKLEVEVEAYDNAGNVAESQKTTVYIDRNSPVISGFNFSLANSIDVEAENGIFKAVDVEDFGFYFKEKVEVKITAQDDIGKDETKAAGVKSITYKAVDITDGVVYEGCVPTENNSITFTVDKNFKGQIYAYATDNVGNSPLDCATCTDDKVIKEGEFEGFIHPNGTILEDGSKHLETSKIEIAAPEKTATQNETGSYVHDDANCMKDAMADYDETQLVPLYKEDPTFSIEVEDTYSGIRSVKYTIIENEVEISEELIIRNDGTKELGDDDWKFTKSEDCNLVYSVERDVVVEGGAYNNMVLLVELTDRAGNTSYDYYMFGIDKDAPIITVQMDDNDNDKYDGYFKAERVAKFIIQERNFSNDGVVFTASVTDENGITKDIQITPDFTVETTDGQPVATPYEGENAGEYYTYTMDYTFVEDGDYTFDIKAIDLVTRENEGVSYVNEAGEDIASISTAFTIDKKVPVVKVVYNNNSAMNGNYYKANRLATITIEEHNFVAEDVEIIGVATDNGVATVFPAISGWINNGNNTYTTTISYINDSKYSFDIAYVDKAGNSISDYVTEEFYIDKTAPTLVITGVADKSANNDKVAPILTYSDTNFNKDTVSIVLVGVNNGKVAYKGSTTDITNGERFTYADFERVESVDDIYTLTATLTDMAGNTTTKTITFSANRFGSVYDLSEVTDIVGKFLQKEKDIVFTEVNVDTLTRESIKIKLTKNGVPSDLVEGKDYTVEVSGGNGQWSKYKYTIKKTLFADDGRYSIAVYSEDKAGNINENIEESKKAEMSFGIDKTNPVVVPVDLEGNKQYAVEMKEVSIEIKDNLVLDGVKIYLNDKEIEYKVDGETYTFNIPESNEKQTVRVVAIDAAGNEHELFVKGFLVSTNLFVRWYNNTPLFIGSIIGAVVVALGIAWFIVFGKKKKDEEE